jgi:hypothetical protein
MVDQRLAIRERLDKKWETSKILRQLSHLKGVRFL